MCSAKYGKTDVRDIIELEIYDVRLRRTMNWKSLQQTD